MRLNIPQIWNVYKKQPCSIIYVICIKRIAFLSSKSHWQWPNLVRRCHKIASVLYSGLPCSSSYQKNHISHHPKLTRNGQISFESAVKAPRSQIVNMFANREQVRPVYAPKHPIDPEGLQETSVQYNLCDLHTYIHTDNCLFINQIL